MRALVLAAGVGSRLRPYTDNRPKPMLEIAGTPIIGHNLAMLAAAGFDDVFVNVHHLGNVVRDYVRDGARWGIRVAYSEETELRGTAGALTPLATSFADDTFAIVFGDNIAELDLTDVLVFHRAKGAVATIVLFERRDVTQSGVAELTCDDRVTRFVEKPQPGETNSHWVNAGVVLAEPELLGAVPPGSPSDLGRDVLPALIAAGRPVFGYRMTGGLWWFDRVEEYQAACRDTRLAKTVFASNPRHEKTRSDAGGRCARLRTS